MRAFIAVDLAPEIKSAVEALVRALRRKGGDVAWVKPEAMHLTLKFLGDIAAGRIPSLADRLRAVAAATRPFTLQVVGVGAFPNLAHPRALWIGVAAPALRSLADAVEAACVAEGFAAERRALCPHVTLGRIRAHSRRGAPDLTLLTPDGGREFGVAPVESLVLFHSELRSEGARHTVLATYPLAGG